MLGIGANDADDAFAVDHFALVTHFFDACSNFHLLHHFLYFLQLSDNATAGQVIRGQFYLDPVTGKQAYKVFLRRPSGVRQNLSLVVEFQPVQQTGELFQHACVGH